MARNFKKEYARLQQVSKQYNFRVPKEIAMSFESKLESEGITYTKFLQEVVKNHASENEVEK